MQHQKDEVIPDAAAVAAFSARLAQFADALSPRERHMLDLLLVAAMHPVDRLRYLPPRGLLNEREEAFLDTLARGNP